MDEPIPGTPHEPDPKLFLTGRMFLFHQVCRGIQCANQNLKGAVLQCDAQKR
jgi:hypothetical protein